MHGEYAPISDYAVIGDCRSVALVARTGSIDWLCWPRFDSPSMFGALLDPVRGGSFRISPAVDYEVTRRYVGATNVLETTFETETGAVVLTDLMTVASEQEKERELWPEHQILRILECTRGSVEIELRCEPRLDYGSVVPELEDAGRLGIQFGTTAHHLTLLSEIPLEIRGGCTAIGTTTLHAGDRVRTTLVSAHRNIAFIPPLGVHADERVRKSIAWWEAWASDFRYDGPYREAVLRSILALKLMTYAPSGAVIAAPTTSLPERIGGERNWDYRYCWLRDASMTLGVFIDLGFQAEGESFLSWMLYATRLSWPEVQVLYDVYGETRVKERELDHLRGYRDSQPVRVGNGAEGQLQLDTYGEVVLAAHQYAMRGGVIGRTDAKMLRGLGRTVCERWRDPDEGIWEERGGRKHHTHSKAMCWVALDRLIDLARAGCLDGPVDRWKKERDAIREEIERRGWNERIGSYVAVYDGDEVDASLLLLGIAGYVDAGSPRMVSTCERVIERLGVNGLLYRYVREDGLPPGEGAFGICSFWNAEESALRGEVGEARREFEHVLSFANDVGLFSEEIDPHTGELLGNFPQAFTHVGLIDAALAIAAAESDQPGAATVEPEERQEMQS